MFELIKILWLVLIKIFLAPEVVIPAICAGLFVYFLCRKFPGDDEEEIQ